MVGRSHSAVVFVLRTYGANGLKCKADTRKHIVIGERFPEWIIENEDLWDAVILPAFALAAFASSASSVKGYFAR